MIVFSGPGLDRAPAGRADPEWLAARRADPSARTVQLSEQGVWMYDGHLLLTGVDGAEIFLGLGGDTPLFAADVTGAEPRAGHPAGLREAAVELPEDEAALAAYAAALLSWHRRHSFCANCGTPTEIADAGHERRCTRCGAHHFPRTDPVVIVRVVDSETDRLLLGRSPRWNPGRYSVLAGFVEPGETLEDAVRREVHEESSVELGAVSYVASQPWPFPELADARVSRAGRRRRAARGRRRARGRALVRTPGGRGGRPRSPARFSCRRPTRSPAA